MRRSASFLVSILATTGAAALPQEGEIWRALDTPGFSILGNADASQLAVVAQNLESLRAVLHRTGGQQAAEAVPIPVIVFQGASSFDPYRQGFGRGAKNVAGFYTESLGDRFIALNGAAGETPFPVVYHEYLHSVVRRQFGRVPVWFNEGLAGVYETFTCDGRAAVVGKAPRDRLRYLADHPWRPLSETLLAEEDARVHDRDDDATRAFYAQSWLLVHDLLFGHPQKRMKELSAFLEAYARGVPHDVALERSFEGGRAGLEAEAKAYLGTRIPYVTLTFDDLAVAPVGAARIVERPEVLLALGRLLLTSAGAATKAAVEHFEAARALAPADPRVGAGLGLAAFTEGRHDDAAALLDTAIAAGVDDVSTLAVAGRIAYLRGKALRARELCARGLAKSPGNVDLLVLYGISFVDEPGDDALGIAALERADQIEPDRKDVLGGLVVLHARARDRSAMEAVARRAEALHDDDLDARVRDARVRLDIDEANDAVEAKDYTKAIALLRSARGRTARETLKVHLDERIAGLEAATKPGKRRPAS